MYSRVAGAMPKAKLQVPTMRFSAFSSRYPLCPRSAPWCLWRKKLLELDWYVCDYDKRTTRDMVAGGHGMKTLIFFTVWHYKCCCGSDVQSQAREYYWRTDDYTIHLIPK